MRVGSALKLLIWIGGLVIVGWFFRPWFHGMVMFAYVHPLIPLAWFLVLAGIFWSIFRFPKQPMVVTAQPGSWLKPSVWLLGLFVGIIAFSMVAVVESDLRYAAQAKRLEYSSRTTLPNLQPVRLTPKEVAGRVAIDSFQDPQEYLGDSQVALIDGWLQRVFPRLPDGGLLYFTKKLSGFVVSDVSSLERKVTIEDAPFVYADGIGVFDNLYFQLYKQKYFVDFSPEPIYLRDDAGEWVTVVPYLTYRGFLIRTPEWGGFYVVYADGTMEDHPPADATKIPWLAGNRVFPKELARYQADSFAYRKGLLNYWFIHEDQTAIVDVPGGMMPYHVATDEGLKQFTSAEPTGSSYGVYKIFMSDATTGELEVVEFAGDSLLTGPWAALTYVKRAFPTFDWSSFYLAEPRPVTVASRFYWLMSIVPNDAAGIVKTVVLDARTNEVAAFDTAAEVEVFLAGTDPTPATSSPPTPPAELDLEVLRTRLDQLEQSVQDLKALLPGPTPAEAQP